jgi:hypothetical protein
MKKYFIEGLLIFLSVLSAFFLESYRLGISDIKLKNNLMLELSSSIKEDLRQINDVKLVLTESMNSGKVLLEDFLSDDKQKKEVVAENFSKLWSMNISYFPRDGIYNQLLATGSLEIIKEEKLKEKLMSVYEHAMSRKEAIDKTIDEFVWRSMQSSSKDIWVTNEFWDGGSNLIIQDYKRNISKFQISENYYESSFLGSFYSHSVTVMARYLSILNRIEEDFSEIQKLIEDELK